MKIELHTISRDGLYEAEAVYVDGSVTVKKEAELTSVLEKVFNLLGR